MKEFKDQMKEIKKNILKGIGRSIGMIVVYGSIALVMHLLGVTIDLTTLPPTLSIEGEVLSTYIIK